MCATEKGHADCMRVLIDAGANKEAKDDVRRRLLLSCRAFLICIFFLCSIFKWTFFCLGLSNHFYLDLLITTAFCSEVQRDVSHFLSLLFSCFSLPSILLLIFSTGSSAYLCLSVLCFPCLFSFSLWILFNIFHCFLNFLLLAFLCLFLLEPCGIKLTPSRFVISRIKGRGFGIWAPFLTQISHLSFNFLHFARFRVFLEIFPPLLVEESQILKELFWRVIFHHASCIFYFLSIILCLSLSLCISVSFSVFRTLFI